VTLSSVAVGYQHFRGPCCLHLHSENEGSKFLTQHLCPTTTLHIITAQKIDLNPHHCENLKSSVV